MENNNEEIEKEGEDDTKMVVPIQCRHCGEMTELEISMMFALLDSKNKEIIDNKTDENITEEPEA